MEVIGGVQEIVIWRCGRDSGYGEEIVMKKKK